MLEDAFTHFEGKVEAIEIRIALLEVIHHSQRLQVMFKAAEIAHAFIERILPGMAERRVAQVVREGDGFDKVFMTVVQKDGTFKAVDKLMKLSSN